MIKGMIAAFTSHPLYIEDINNILSIKGINNLAGKSFLITGATGMLGVVLIDALMVLPDVKIYAVGRCKEKAFNRLQHHFSNPDFVFIQQDVTTPFDADLVVDYIIPLASNTHPLGYSRYPIETMLINLKGAKYALDLAAVCGATVIYPSSVEIYGDTVSDKGFDEGSNGALNLSTSRACYTESKRSCEALCQSYAAEKGTKVKIIRLSRIFGSTMLKDDTKASSQFIQNALACENIVMKSKGLQYFSYVYVADAIAGLLYVLLYGENARAYNVSSEKANICLKDFAGICADFVGSKVVFNIPNEEEKKGYSVVKNAILDNSLIKSIGYTPIYSIDEAINRTIKILKGLSE